MQVKLTVVAPEQLDEIVPKISLYANTQNKVNEADFSANDPFHVQLERFEDRLRPQASDRTQRRWFYERARGQYADEKSRRARRNRRRNSRRRTHDQKFTKTDLAKFENTWGTPHLVGRAPRRISRNSR